MPPPVMTDEFYEAIKSKFYSVDLYDPVILTCYLWMDHYQPIEDEI